MNPLKQLEACGQSPWLDYLKRSLIEKGELRTLIERDGLKGLTSNPSIFEKAIGESDEYADALKQFQVEATLSGYLKSHFGRVHAKAGDYVALLAYIQRDEAHTQALTGMRARIRDKTRAATCLGFGPRFQHSTGQAYKGGPNSGVFLQITCDDPADIEVPGHSYTFGVVKAAQARSDLDVLVERGRRALRVHLKDVDAGLAELGRAIDTALE
jgi:transaldolase/glucose-6-phosphate isomerase